MIAKNVKKVLIDQEVSVTELAKRTGYTRQYLSALFNGRVDSPRAKKMVAFTLGKNFCELWTDQDTPQCQAM
mgnify:CR=1 FL=1